MRRARLPVPRLRRYFPIGIHEASAAPPTSWALLAPVELAPGADGSGRNVASGCIKQLSNLTAFTGAVSAPANAAGGALTHRAIDHFRPGPPAQAAARCQPRRPSSHRTLQQSYWGHGLDMDALHCREKSLSTPRLEPGRHAGSTRRSHASPGSRAWQARP